MKNLRNCQNVINRKLPSLEVFSDASSSGWGAAHLDKSTGGNWTHVESNLHINVLELKAAFYALQIYCNNLENTTVLFKIDNTSTVAWINKQTGPNEMIFELVKKIRDFCIVRNIWVQACYIKSKNNIVADFESRKIRDNLEWSLKPENFNKIVTVWQRPIVDLFASTANNKCKKFCSLNPDPNATGVAAFGSGFRE